MPRQVLGRGLEALIPTQNKTPLATNSAQDGGRISLIPINEITPNPHQPRRHFAPAELADLANSIRKHGVLQPLIVTKIDGGYELIAGERRVRAARQVGLKVVPAIIKEATEQDKLELAVVENLHRHDLNPLEQARAYHRLIEEFKLTQEGVAMRVGKSRESVANTLRFLELPPAIQEALAEEKITSGHAKALLGLRSEAERMKLFREILSSKLNVRTVEKRVQLRRPGRRQLVDPFLNDTAERLREKLGARVQVSAKGRGARVTVDCYSRDELITVVQKIIGLPL